MNPTQLVDAARPEVQAMPAVARRQLRERLFDAASGAYSAPSTVEINSTNARRANALRLGALLLFGLVAVGGLAFSATRDRGDAADPELATTIAGKPSPSAQDGVVVIAPPAVTVAPTTTEAPVAGTSATPLLLPEPRTRLDELTVVRKALGGSTLMLRAPDFSTVSLREADGVAPTPPEPAADTEPADDGAETTVPVRPRVIGSLEVTQPGESGLYDVLVPCGTLQVRDGGGFLPYRPEIVELFGSMQLVDGSIRVNPPEGWAVISVGPSADEFALGIPVEVAGRSVSIRLTQYPDGNLAVAGWGDGQFAQRSFLGQDAWISRDPDEPGDFEVIGMLGTTAFSVEASDLAVSELEDVMRSLVPGSVDDWIERFGPLAAGGDPDVRTCQAQPEFVLGASG